MFMTVSRVSFLKMRNVSDKIRRKNQHISYLIASPPPQQNREFYVIGNTEVSQSHKNRRRQYNIAQAQCMMDS
jgi:hypothetical protein